MSIGAHVADAPEVAHRNGIVHRDVKPASIFVSDTSHSKLLDFGVAKVTRQFAVAAGNAAASNVPGRELTETGVALGTAAYMSPEQVRGEEFDERLDSNAFGWATHTVPVM